MLVTSDIFEYLRSISYNSYVDYLEDKIIFNLDDLHILCISFEANKLLTDKFEWNLDDMDFAKYIDFTKEISMSLSGLSLWSVDDLPDAYTNSQLSHEFYLVLKRLYEAGCLYDNCELKYGIYEDGCLGMGCPETYKFGYCISFDTSLQINIDIIKKIVECVSVEWDLKSIYCNSLTIPDSHPNLNLLSTNTKARRLGYIKGFINIFNGEDRISESVFENRLRANCILYFSQLNEYINNKGAIRISQQRVGFQPYMELANSLGFIYIRNNGYELGKYGQLYQRMIENTSNISNVFYLSLLDKSYFLESILSNDFLSVFVILEYAFVNNESNYHNLVKHFLPRIQKYLESSLDFCENSRDKYVILSLKKRLSEWKKPDVYLEHIIMPRLNWLLDLELINIDNKLVFTLTNSGITLFSHLSQWIGLSMGCVSIPSFFVERFFMKVFSATYQINVNYDTDFEPLLKKYLDLSFDKFRTLAPNRVTYSSYVGYAKRMLLLNDNVAIDEYEIKKFLNKETDTYVFKYQRYYKDGYIQKK